MEENFIVFISECNNITNYLIKKYGLESNTTFGQAIIYCENKDKIIKYYKDELLMLRDLRNVLTHQQDSKHILADPTDETVNRIRRIKEKVINPSVVGKLFHSKVTCFDAKESIEKALKVVNEFDYTQFPVFYENRFIGVLTENGITRWLSRKAEQDIISISETRILDVLELEESKDNYQFISPNSNIYDLEDRFLRGYRNSNRTLILLITGKKDPTIESDFTGIITYADMPKIYDHI